MLAMYEGILQSEEVMIVVLIELAVKLHWKSVVTSRRSPDSKRTKSRTETSIMLWLKYAVLFLTTLTATTSCVFKF